MTKADDRRLRVLEFFDWIKNQDEWTYRDGLLQAYSFKTGVSVRTIREYYDVLFSIGAVGSENVEFTAKRKDGSEYSYYRRKRVFNPERLN